MGPWILGYGKMNLIEHYINYKTNISTVMEIFGYLEFSIVILGIS